MRPHSDFLRDDIPVPAYIADVKAIRLNLRKAERIKKESGAKLLLATKAFSMPPVLPYLSDVLDGMTASGLYEAKIGRKHFGKEVHCYSPAYEEKDIVGILDYADHIYFNSVGQLERFGAMVKSINPNVKIGLRVNAGLSQAFNLLYDPSAPGCRFGAQKEELTADVLKKIDVLHFHNLCKNMAEESVALLRHISDRFSDELSYVSDVNLGGGYFYAHEEFDLDFFIENLAEFQKKNKVQAVLEPGWAHVYDAGYLSATVLDIVHNASTKTAMLNVSASAHMPDVLEVPYTPELIGADIIHAKEDCVGEFDYVLGGNTCMSGDVIGHYRFSAPLAVGQTIFFCGMLQYAHVKNNFFNGVAMPSHAIWDEDDSFRVTAQFTFSDYERYIGG